MTAAELGAFARYILDNAEIDDDSEEGFIRVDIPEELLK